MKEKINAFDYAGHICKAMNPGILLTTKSGDKVNTMTIGWGTIGIEWGKPIFVGYVRESRYTREMLDQNGEFTMIADQEKVYREAQRCAEDLCKRGNITNRMAGHKWRNLAF